MLLLPGEAEKVGGFVPGAAATTGEMELSAVGQLRDRLFWHGDVTFV